MNRRLGEFDEWEPIDDIITVEDPPRGSRRKVVLLLGLIMGLVFATGIYAFASGALEVQGAAFPPLAQMPQVGEISAQAPMSSRYAGVRIDEPAPDFTFIDPAGQTRKLSDYKGQAVMINFWASWCPYCVKEMPDIEAVYRERNAAGFVVLGISLDEDADAAREFLQRHGITFPSVIDTYRVATLAYRISPIPTSFFIDREGKVRDVQIGAMSKSTLNKKVDKIM